MLETLPPLPPAHLANFISALNSLATRKPALFEPHFGALLSFLGPRILPSTEAASTPTDSKPSGDNTNKHKDKDRDREDEEEKEAMMKAALEFMITLSEAQSSTANDVDGWAAAILRGCLEGMGTLRDDDLEEWLNADVRAPSLFAGSN
jgi:importin-5